MSSAAVQPLSAYISTPLTGLADGTRRAIDETVAVVKAVCAGPGVGIEPYFPGDHTDPLRDAHVSPEEVFRRDRERIKSSDVMLLVANTPSTGVGQELNMALESLLPVVFLAPAGTQVSRMARGVPSFNIELAYADPGELRWRLDRTLRALRPRLESRRAALRGLDENRTGERIRAERRRRRLSRAQLADATGLTVAGIDLLERSPDRESDPSLTQLRRVAAVLGVSVGDLV